MIKDFKIKFSDNLSSSERLIAASIIAKNMTMFIKAAHETTKVSDDDKLMFRVIERQSQKTVYVSKP